MSQIKQDASELRQPPQADADLVSMLREFFRAEVTPEVVARGERDGSWPPGLWERAEAADIPWIGIPEAHGGVGGSLADVAALMYHAGYHAAPLPLLEHHLAATLGGRAGLLPAAGPLTLTGLATHAGAAPLPQVRARGGLTGELHGRLPAVPWAAACSALVVLTRDEDGRDVAAVVDLATDGATDRATDGATVTLEPEVDLAGTPIPTVTLTKTAVAVGTLVAAVEFRRYAEVLRCAELAGLQSRLFDLTAEYVQVREQFGRPIGSFQAVQTHVVTLAQCAAMSQVAVERAAGAVAVGGGEFEVAAASVVVGQAVVRATTAAHQAHGAIGITREYPLQQVTRRIHALRQRWGSLDSAEAAVGTLALARPSLSRLIAQHPLEGTDSHE